MRTLFAAIVFCAFAPGLVSACVTSTMSPKRQLQVATHLVRAMVLDVHEVPGKFWTFRHLRLVHGPASLLKLERRLVHRGSNTDTWFVAYRGRAANKLTPLIGQEFLFALETPTYPRQRHWALPSAVAIIAPDGSVAAEMYQDGCLQESDLFYSRKRFEKLVESVSVYAGSADGRDKVVAEIGRSILDQWPRE